MKHPTSKAVFEVVERFKSVLHLAILPYHLKMSEMNVVDNGSCGTVACHAGWYLLAKRIAKERFYYRSGYHKDEFLKGIVAINNDLGFPKINTSGNNMYDTPLLKWADDNEVIWGSRYGGAMFNSRGNMAFKTESRPDGVTNLRHIIDHWTEVGERLLALENEQQPAYVNISKQLAVLPTEETSDKIIAGKTVMVENEQ